MPAVVVAFISYQQFWLAREKLKLDLFEKRFAVFAAARRFLSEILQYAALQKMEDLWQYRAGISQASFLFDEEVTDFLMEVDKRAIHLWTLTETLKGVQVGPTRTKMVEEMSAEVSWLTSQLSMSKPVFEPYMKFRQWRWSLWRRGGR